MKITHAMTEDDRARVDRLTGVIEYRGAHIAANINTLSAIILMLALGVAIWFSLPSGRGNHAGHGD